MSGHETPDSFTKQGVRKLRGSEYTRVLTMIADALDDAGFETGDEIEQASRDGEIRLTLYQKGDDDD